MIEFAGIGVAVSNAEDELKNKADYICGHNIIHHDAKYLFTDKIVHQHLVDTLYVSPLLFPEHPYHKLVKDDKLINDQINNPVNDCEKARDLLLDEIAQWNSLPEEKRQIFALPAGRNRAVAHRTALPETVSQKEPAVSGLGMSGDDAQTNAYFPHESAQPGA